MSWTFLWISNTGGHGRISHGVNFPEGCQFSVTVGGLSPQPKFFSPAAGLIFVCISIFAHRWKARNNWLFFLPLAFLRLLPMLTSISEYHILFRCSWSLFRIFNNFLIILKYSWVLGQNFRKIQNLQNFEKKNLKLNKIQKKSLTLVCRPVT